MLSLEVPCNARSETKGPGVCANVILSPATVSSSFYLSSQTMLE